MKRVDVFLPLHCSFTVCNKKKHRKTRVCKKNPVFVHHVLIVLSAVRSLPGLSAAEASGPQKVVSHGCAVQITLLAVRGFAAVWEVSGERCWFKRGRKLFSRSAPHPPTPQLFFPLWFPCGNPTAFTMGDVLPPLPPWGAQCSDAGAEKDEGPNGICFFLVCFVSCRTLPSFLCPNSLISYLPSYHEDGKRFSLL